MLADASLYVLMGVHGSGLFDAIRHVALGRARSSNPVLIAHFLDEKTVKKYVSSLLEGRQVAPRRRSSRGGMQVSSHSHRYGRSTRKSPDACDLRPSDG